MGAVNLISGILSLSVIENLSLNEITFVGHFSEATFGELDQGITGFHQSQPKLK